MTYDPEIVFDIAQETEKKLGLPIRVSKWPFDSLTALSEVEGLKRSGNGKQLLSRSGATSIFDVRCWTFDVGRLIFSLI